MVEKIAVAQSTACLQGAGAVHEGGMWRAEGKQLKSELHPERLVTQNKLPSCLQVRKHTCQSHCSQFIVVTLISCVQYCGLNSSRQAETSRSFQLQAHDAEVREDSWDSLLEQKESLKWLSLVWCHPFPGGILLGLFSHMTLIFVVVAFPIFITQMSIKHMQVVSKYLPSTFYPQENLQETAQGRAPPPCRPTFLWSIRI